MIGAIYQGRKFDSYDTHQTGLALSCYAIGLTGYAAIKVLAPAFYALGSARMPMLVSIASILINYLAAYSLTRWTKLGHAGLALATSGVALFGAVVLFGVLRSRLGGIHVRRLLKSTLKIGVRRPMYAEQGMPGLILFSATPIDDRSTSALAFQRRFDRYCSSSGRPCPARQSSAVRTSCRTRQSARA